jgi:hypoxanthine phosphoribosyltransferase
MSTITAEQALTVLREAELICTPQQIEIALDRMAVAIAAQLASHDPLVLIVMNGAFIPAAQLLSRLNFPLRVGYLHATRYRGATRGGDINWIAPPRPAGNRIRPCWWWMTFSTRATRSRRFWPKCVGKARRRSTARRW